MSRSGQDYIGDLRDDRCVFLDGTRVASVPDHPSLRSAVRTVSSLYDFQARPENAARMTYETPTGKRVSRSWQLPTSHRELVERREALVALAELHHGFMGRSPDHVASTLAAMSMGTAIYDAHPGGRSGHVQAVYEYARDRDLYVSYVIIDPQGDRSKATGEAGNADLAVSIVDEDAEGITVRGTKMLGTGAVLSDEVLVTTLRPKDDDRYAFTAVVPIGIKGLSSFCRAVRMKER